MNYCGRKVTRANSSSTINDFNRSESFKRWILSTYWKNAVNPYVMHHQNLF